KHSIEYGDIVAKFGLSDKETDETRKKTLFSSYYGKSISSAQGNNSFLTRFERNYRLNKNIIEESAKSKFSLLYSLITTIQKKYGALSGSVYKKINLLYKSHKKDPKNMHYYAKLAEMHNLTKNIPFLPPEDSPRVTSNYGRRIHPKTKKQSFHKGIDLAGRPSCAIRASGDGIVEEVSSVKGYGNNVVIRHAGNILTRYAHLGKINVKQGQKLILGQIIGTQGLSGTTKGEHLHFEIIINNKTVNPKDFIQNSL
ncbi:MAG: M23 family metallopeptidase, partial [Rickettsiaceae bacterium]|nr:M23 family metallopeptidase [Rickettsiaceae bacterium]